MALPVSVTNALFPTGSISNLGPFISSAGNVYFVSHTYSSASGGGQINLYKATDPTSSFSSVVNGNGFNSGAGNPDPIGAMGAVQDGDIIHAALQANGSATGASGEGPGSIKYIEFDLSDDSEVGRSNLYGPTDAPTTFAVDISVRSDGDVIVVYHGENPASMGGTYQEIAYSRREAAVWTNGVVVESTATKNEPCLYPSISIGSSDSANIFFGRYDAAIPTTSYLAIKHLSSANSLGTTHIISFRETPATAGSLIATQSGSAETVHVVDTKTSGDAFRTIQAMPHVTDQTDPVHDFESLSDPINLTNAVLEHGMACDYGDTNQPVYIGYYNTTASSSLRLDTDNGTALLGASLSNVAADITTGTPTSIDGLSANIFERSGNVVYGFIYDEAGTVKYDEYVIRSLSVTAALTTGAFSLGGTGEIITTGSGALTVPAIAFQGTGEVTVTGSGALDVPASALQGTGERTITGSGALVVPSAALAGTGDVVTPVTTVEVSWAEFKYFTSAAGVNVGSLTVPSAALLGTAERIITGTGNLTIPQAALQGTGEREITGIGSQIYADPGISIVETHTSTESSGGTTNIIFDNALQEGDTVLVLRSGTSAGPNSKDIFTEGYTRLFLYTNPAIVGDYKRMGPTPDTSVITRALGALSYPGCSIVYVLRGVKDLDIRDAIEVHFDPGANGSTVDPAPITTIADDVLVMAIAAFGNGGNDTITGFPSGYTNFVTVSSGGLANGSAFAAATKLLTAPATEDPGIFTLDNTRNPAAVTLAIAPAGVLNGGLATPAAVLAGSGSRIIPATGDLGTPAAVLQGTGERTIPGWGAFVTNSDISILGQVAVEGIPIGGFTTVPLVGLVEGDVVVVARVGPGSNPVSNPAGYEEISTASVMAKRMGPTPDTFVDVPTLFGAIIEGAGVVYIIRSIDGEILLDVPVETFSHGLTGTAANPPLITPVTADTLIMALGYFNQAGSVNSYPVGYTNTLDANFGGFTMGAAVKLLSSAGGVSEDPGSFVFNGITGGLSARTIAFRSAKAKSGGLDMPAALLSGSGARTANATGNLQIPSAVLASTGERILAGTGNLQIPAAALQGTGVVGRWGWAAPNATADISIVESHTAQMAASTAATVNFSTTLEEGDVVVVVRNGQFSNPIINPAGYEQFADVSVNVRFVCDFKRMGVTPDTFVDLEPLSLSNPSTGIVYVLRGVDQDVFLDQTLKSFKTGLTSNSADPPAITPVTDDTLVMAFGATSTPGASVTSFPAGYTNTEGVNNGIGVGTMGGAVKLLSGGTGVAEDPNPFSFSSFTNPTGAITIAVRSAKARSGGLNVPAVLLASAGERSITGVGALLSSVAALQGTGERTITGSGALSIAPVELLGTGTVLGSVTGSGNLTIPLTFLTSTGEITKTGAGSLTVPLTALDGAGERTITASGALVIGSAEIDAVAGISAFIIFRPDGDDAIGFWEDELGGTTDIWQSVDEATVDDADYIRSETSPASSVYRMSLTDPTGAVDVDGTHEIVYRYGKGGDSEELDLNVRLVQGASILIASWQHLNVSAGFITVTQTLSAGERAAITNYSDLFLEFEASTPWLLADGIWDDAAVWNDSQTWKDA